jgi:thaumarchaeosortase
MKPLVLLKAGPGVGSAQDKLSYSQRRPSTRLKNFFRISLRDPPVIFYFVLLLLVAFLAAPSSFAFAWNEGRSGLLAIVPLAVLEMWRDSARPLGDRTRVLVSYLILLIATLYYIASSLQLFTKALVSFAVGFGVDIFIAQFSWIATVDYTASGVFVVLLTYLVVRGRPVTPAIFTWGMASFLFTDTVLPYDSLGPFQAFVPPMLQVVAFLVNISPFGHAVPYGNILVLSNSNTTLNLAIFWPSAGLHGIVISVLAVAAIAMKLGTGWTRGGLYLLLGVVGSVLINLIRITILAFYALGGSGPLAFERFHSVVGELLFLPWIAVYLFLIIRHENVRRVRLESASPA